MLGAVFGIVFGGIGISVIGFLWTVSGFGEPPFFFKVFGSLIALAGHASAISRTISWHQRRNSTRQPTAATSS